MKERNIPCYLNFLPADLLDRLEKEGESVPGIPGLTVGTGLLDRFPAIESEEALRFLVRVYQEIRSPLREVLEQRIKDRRFLDEATRDCVDRNATRPYLSSEYETALGMTDESGRIVVGPLQDQVSINPLQDQASIDSLHRVVIPDFLKGDQVTLFGPPNTARMSINAMNAFNRKSPDEPSLVTRLVEESGQLPIWRADSEDSKTTMMADLLLACENLKGCFDGTLTYTDTAREKVYRLDERGLSKPIKRIPGLALPDGSHLWHGSPLPLHLVDFGFHLFHNWDRPEALVFYVPKLENEEESAYLKLMIMAAEREIQAGTRITLREP